MVSNQLESFDTSKDPTKDAKFTRHCLSDLWTTVYPSLLTLFTRLATLSATSPAESDVADKNQDTRGPMFNVSITNEAKRRRICVSECHTPNDIFQSVVMSVMHMKKPTFATKQLVFSLQLAWNTLTSHLVPIAIKVAQKFSLNVVEVSTVVTLGRELRMQLVNLGQLVVLDVFHLCAALTQHAQSISDSTSTSEPSKSGAYPPIHTIVPIHSLLIAFFWREGQTLMPLEGLSAREAQQLRDAQRRLLGVRDVANAQTVVPTLEDVAERAVAQSKWLSILCTPILVRFIFENSFIIFVELLTRSLVAV